MLIVIGIANSGSSDEKNTADSTPSAQPAVPSVEAPPAVAPPAAAAPPAAPAPTTTIPPLAPKPPTGNGKTVVYEVISDSDSLNSVTWFDENSAIQQETSASAPWSKTVTNKSTYVIAGLGAQTEGTSVTCRVTVDGVVKDEQTATGQYAVVNCNG
ncbi:MmpS family transport accessory protein [Aldersonia kunmingensis]|uniref:MmpS family transport accessory protein n=1 Tax=Aldersonia kunmingensis TaxID=408066 RepID=UPI0012ED2EB6|nr:MmpS family transport accessory protein [Aldersonia kunmingensis]